MQQAKMSGISRLSNQFTSKRLCGGTSLNPVYAKPTADNVKSTGTVPPRPCVHVSDFVDRINGNFPIALAKCGLCSATPYEKSLWVCLMPRCFFVGCADPDHLGNGHREIHQLQNPDHLIQMNLQSGNAYCWKCDTLVDITSKFKNAGVVKLNFEMLASIKLSLKEENLFETITEACVGSDEERRSSALRVLETDKDLHKLLPRFFKFVVSGVNFENANLTKMILVMKMLRSLLNNQWLSCVFQKHQRQVIQSVGNCITSSRLPLECDIGDHWYLRSFASRIMADICSGDNVLATKVANRLCCIYSESNPALTSFYGVISGLSDLGPEFIKGGIIPYIGYIASKIDGSMNKGMLERIAAKHVRNILIKSVSPVLKTLRNPPDLAKFGTLGPHFQLSGHSKQLVETAPGRAIAPPPGQRALPSSGSAPAGRGLPVVRPHLHQTGDVGRPGEGRTHQEVSRPEGQERGELVPGRGLPQDRGCGDIARGGSVTGVRDTVPAIHPLAVFPRPTASAPVHNQLDESEQVVQQATSSLNNTIVAKPQQVGGGRSRPNEESARISPTTTAPSMSDPGLQGEVHVYGIKDWLTEEIIRHNFKESGTILAVYLSKVGYCHIRFSCKEEADRCIADLNGKFIIGRRVKITRAKIAKCNVVSGPHYIYCEQSGLCYNYNISDNGCGRKRCPRKHVCLFCHQLYGVEVAHRSRYDCPEEREAYVHYPPREDQPQSATSNNNDPIVNSGGDQEESPTSSDRPSKKLKLN